MNLHRYAENKLLIKIVFEFLFIGFLFSSLFVFKQRKNDIAGSHFQ